MNIYNLVSLCGKKWNIYNFSSSILSTDNIISFFFFLKKNVVYKASWFLQRRCLMFMASEETERNSTSKNWVPETSAALCCVSPLKMWDWWRVKLVTSCSELPRLQGRCDRFSGPRGLLSDGGLEWRWARDQPGTGSRSQAGCDVTAFATCWFSLATCCLPERNWQPAPQE